MLIKLRGESIRKKIPDMKRQSSRDLCGVVSKRIAVSQHLPRLARCGFFGFLKLDQSLEGTHFHLLGDEEGKSKEGECSVVNFNYHELSL